MIASASLPVSVDAPEDYHVPEAAMEALALLLIEAADAEADEPAEWAGGAGA